MYNITLDIAALGILVLVLIVYNTLYITATDNDKKFNIFLCSLLGTCIFDMASAYTISNYTTVPLWLNYVTLCLFFLFSGITGFTLTIFLFTKMFNTPHSQAIMDINLSIFIVYSFLCISAPMTKAIFYFTNDGYFKGPLHITVYLILGYFFIVSGLVICNSREQFSKRQFYLQLAFLILTALGIVLQLIMPQIMISVFVASLSTIVWLLSISAPDYNKLYESTKQLEAYQTELEEAHAKLTSSSKSTQELTHSASWALYFDKDRNVIDSTWSSTFFSMLGYDESEVEALSKNNIWEESLHPEDKERASQSFISGMLSQSPYDIRYRLKDKYGTYKWYKGTGNVIRDSEGNLSVYQGIIQDIDEEVAREKLTEEKLSILEELKKSQKALEQALLDAEEANLSKSRFLSSMSHDIRTPMNSIVGFADLAMENMDNPEKVRDYLEKIQLSSTHLLNLVNDILDMNKIESGNFSLLPEKNNLVELINTEVDLLQGRIYEKKLNLKIDFSEVVNPNVKIDRLRFSQILINCISNSIEYTPEGGNINIDVREIPTKTLKQSKYQLIIKDTGVGQLPDSGIGMTISKKLVDLMDGTFNTNSSIDAGTTYIITLALEVYTPDEEQPISVLEKENKKIEQIINSLAKMHFLLVDDNEVNRVLAKAVLNSKLITIDEATNGQEALDILTQKPANTYDLILMDIQMPVMDGYEATKKIRDLTDPLLANIPILAMTADAFDDDKQKCLDYGMNGHLAKPFRVNDLIYALAEVLNII